MILLLIKPSRNLAFTQAVIQDLHKGLSLMTTLQVPNHYMLSLKNLHIMASIGPKGRIRTFTEVM